MTLDSARPSFTGMSSAGTVAGRISPTAATCSLR